MPVEAKASLVALAALVARRQIIGLARCLCQRFELHDCCVG